MTAKNNILLGGGMMLFILGFTMLIMPMSIPFSEDTINIMTIFGSLMIIAGIVLFVLFVVKFSKETKQSELERQNAVTAAMSKQAQAEYNKKIAAYSKDGAHADEKVQAKLFAQVVHTLTLKAPSTAVYSDLNETAIAENDGMYTVTGWVDAQNSYGAMIRTPFSIIVFKKDGMWQTGSVFESTETAIKKKFAARYVMYLVLAVISTAVLYFVIRAIMEF